VFVHSRRNRFSASISFCRLLFVTPANTFAFCNAAACIPVITAYLKQMRVAELLDKHFPTNGNYERSYQQRSA
jgi:hypothetical protein